MYTSNKKIDASTRVRIGFPAAVVRGTFSARTPQRRLQSFLKYFPVPESTTPASGTVRDKLAPNNTLILCNPTATFTHDLSSLLHGLCQHCQRALGFITSPSTVLVFSLLYDSNHTKVKILKLLIMIAARSNSKCTFGAVGLLISSSAS